MSLNEVLKLNAPISVIITTYNDQIYLDQALISVLSQSISPSQIIVVDDGSDQPISDLLIARYVNNINKIEVIFLRKKNGGPSSARNFGLARANHKYVAFLDVDDKMLPNNLRDKYLLIKELNDDYFGVYGGSIKSTGHKEIFNSLTETPTPDLLDIPDFGIPGGAPFYLFNKHLIIEIGGFDENLHCNEDYDLIIRLLKNNKKCKGCLSPGFYRNLRPNSLSRPKDPLVNFANRMQFLEKAEKNSFYSLEFLNYRKMAIHISCGNRLILRKDFIKAFQFWRMGFKFGKPKTLSQKILYIISFSFLNYLLLLMYEING